MNLKKKILIIEDSSDIQETLTEILETQGFEVESASNGKDGLDRLINRELPELILLDLRMPVMNGEEFRRHQLQIPYLARIPVILMSADSYVSRKANFLKAERVLKKPFRIDDLLDLMDDALQSRNQTMKIPRELALPQ